MFRLIFCHFLPNAYSSSRETRERRRGSARTSAMVAYGHDSISGFNHIHGGRRPVASISATRGVSRLVDRCIEVAARSPSTMEAWQWQRRSLERLLCRLVVRHLWLV